MSPSSFEFKKNFNKRNLWFSLLFCRNPWKLKINVISKFLVNLETKKGNIQVSSWSVWKYLIWINYDKWFYDYFDEQNDN